MRLVIPLILITLGDAAMADIVVPNRTIRPGEIISPADLQLKPAHVPGAVEDAQVLYGQEARVALYPGRPVHPSDVGPPAIVDRNQLVMILFHKGGLWITTEGRALGRGAEGDVIRVMNLTSRSTVSGRVNADGTIKVN